MKPQELKQARQHNGWTQEQAASHLGVTQAYLNLLENGKRRLTPWVVRQAVSVYGLSPEVLPVGEDFVPTQTSDDQLVERLARLGYPGFAYVKTHTAKKNPYEVLLTALGQTTLDGRVAEALPWVAMKYARPDTWLVGNARKFNLQNKLGFVVGLARRVADGHRDHPRSEELGKLEDMLEESRLVKEGFFYRPPLTEREREWLLKNRTGDAAHWNLLADMRPEQLSYAR
ncbi:MAG TPA: helix-turn-helix transcriptional regulator [Candidatus Acidoferrales bacterium]|nr:helix-turn-helix transcriptional regulator [Candidatus Acidoferrales bacterium]